MALRTAKGTLLSDGIRISFSCCRAVSWRISSATSGSNSSTPPRKRKSFCVMAGRDSCIVKLGQPFYHGGYARNYAESSRGNAQILAVLGCFGGFERAAICEAGRATVAALDAGEYFVGGDFSDKRVQGRTIVLR